MEIVFMVLAACALAGLALVELSQPVVRRGRAAATVALCGGLVFLLTDLYLSKGRGERKLTICKSGLKNLGSSCEEFAAERHGQFPSQLTLLTPKYMSTLPRCPAGGTYEYSASPTAYTIYCSGLHHDEAGLLKENFPQFTSTAGLVSPEY